MHVIAPVQTGSTAAVTLQTVMWCVVLTEAKCHLEQRSQSRALQAQHGVGL